ncbi:MAG: glycosyltransferase family 4 protein, partial [Planctomycetota bacterium]
AGTHLFVLPWDLSHQAGGVNQVVASLWREMERHGSPRPAVLVTRWESARPETAVVEGRTTVYLRLRSPHDPASPLRSFALFLATLPATLWRLRRIARRQRVATFNPHYPGLWAWNFLLLRGSRLVRCRIVLSVHGNDLDAWSAGSPWVRFLWRRLVRGVDSVVACSRELANRIATLDPACARRTAVIHNGVDAAGLRAKAEGDPSLPEELRGRPYVLHVGSFERRKAHDVLFEAFRRVSADRPGIHLALAGGTGPLSPEMPGMIAAAGLAGRAHIFENVPHDRVAALLAGALAFALPSRYEGFPLVLLEAGVFGLPVVATAVGGVGELIRDGEDGLLVRPDDAPALADRLARLLDSADERARLGASLRRTVEERFTWERVRARYAGLKLDGGLAVDGRSDPVPRSD